MFAGFLLTLREGLEAALIIGLLLGTLKKFKQSDFRKQVWLGAGSAVFSQLDHRVFPEFPGSKIFR